MSDQTITVVLWVGGLAATCCAGGISILLASHKRQGDAIGTLATATTRIETALTGIDGQNGIAGDLRATKKRLHDLADDMQPLVLDVERLKAERDLRRRAG